MDWLLNAIWHDGSLFGIKWTGWELVGWTGNLIFSSRFFVQWWATEKQKRVVVPPLFWWLSMAGSGCLLLYGFSQKNSVFVFAYLFTWIPYIRNLVIGGRFARAEQPCGSCGSVGAPSAKYCYACGVKLVTSSEATTPA